MHYLNICCNLTVEQRVRASRFSISAATGCGRDAENALPLREDEIYIKFRGDNVGSKL